MLLKIKAYSVHVLTATGAVFAMLALLEAAKGDWPMMFLWLVVALIVDGIDGPLARRYQVKENAAVIDGALLDLIIDYLTYVFIPAFALFQSGLLPGWTGWVGILIITFASALYFADVRMKTSDHSFHGFPASWNMVAIVCFAVEPSAAVIVGCLVLLAISMFTRLKFVHPVRTQRWRLVSLPVALLWIAFAGWSAWEGFAQPDVVTWGLVVTSLYLMVAGVAQQIIPARQPKTAQ